MLKRLLPAPQLQYSPAILTSNLDSQQLIVIPSKIRFPVNQKSFDRITVQK